MRTLLVSLVLCVLSTVAYSQTEIAYCNRSSGMGVEASGPVSDHFDMKYLWLDLAADNLSTSISGSSTLLVEIIQEEPNEFILELIDELDVLKVTVDGKEVNFAHHQDLLYISRPSSVHAGDLVSISVTYEGTPNPASAGIFSGINNAQSKAWGNQITWTLSEPFNTKTWWPAKQDLNDKIDSVSVHITVPNHLKVGSNGTLTRSLSLIDGKTRHEWKSTYPMAYYLVAFTVGEYVEYNNYAKPTALSGDSIFIQNYLYNNPETLPYYKDELDMIPEMMELFSELFGLYPFHQEKYGHVMAPFSGGMEHQTMSSMGIFTFGLDAHELGHQWFGDHVTCATWNDIWINEGFARYCEYIAAEKLLSVKNARAIMEDDMLSVTGTDTGSVYIPLDEKLTDSRIFQYRLTYLKGGLLINMIRELVDDDALFFRTLRIYLQEYGGRSASGEDFRAILERETKMDFGSFFQQWYYGGGFPIFDITWTKMEGDTLGISIHQSTTDDVPFFSTPLEFQITFKSGQIKRLLLRPEENIQFFKVPASGQVKTLTFDPDKWLIKKVNSFHQVDENGNIILSTSYQSPEELIVFPNPATTEIHLSRKVNSIKIYDTTGRSILLIQLNHQVQTIDISELNPGLYFFQAADDSQLWNGKFLKE